METYKGIIIKESLVDPTILEGIKVISTRTEVDQDDPNNIWHFNNVEVSRDDIENLQTHLKREGGWYMHFWRGQDVMVVFRDKLFEIKYDDKSTWKDAVEYGRSIGIPAEQLDFLIE